MLLIEPQASVLCLGSGFSLVDGWGRGGWREENGGSPRGLKVVDLGVCMGEGGKLETHKARPSFLQKQTTVLKHSPNKFMM